MLTRRDLRVGLGMTALLLLVGLGAAGCGDEDELEGTSGPIRHVAALLARVPRESIVRLSAEDTLHVSASTRTFYRWRFYRSSWTDGTTVLPKGMQIYAALESAADDGLDPRSYGWHLARAILDRLDAERPSPPARAKLLGELDLVLTEGFTRYAHDLVQGTVDPAQNGLEWRIARDTTLGSDVLKAARREPIAQLVERLRPASPYYGRLVRALASYRAVSKRGGWPQLAAEERPSQSGQLGGAATGALRERLAAGDDPIESRLAAHGAARPTIFDDSLRAALAHFQSRNGVDEDGALGANTLRELNHTVADRIADLKLNLDRWRWLPRELGRRYIVVNVAGFELEMIEDGWPVVAMNVVVGKEGWNTPIFADTMESLVVNPSWNVPESIARGEVLPALLRDPGYLDANDFDVVKGGRVVPVSSVDLARTSTYRFRQRPGPDNALGRLKFMLPNSDDIYLHDTQAGRLFSLTDRAFSHGCIRLERPMELARALMSSVTDASPDALDAKLAAGTEATIRFREGVPVYILYFTAWVDEDGTVSFPHDVYGRDGQLEPERLKKLEHPKAAGQGPGKAT